MDYDIYDMDSANLVESLPTEEEALALVRRAVQEDGPEAVASWALGRSDHRGGSISGRELVERALAVHA